MVTVAYFTGFNSHQSFAFYYEWDASFCDFLSPLARQTQLGGPSSRRLGRFARHRLVHSQPRRNDHAAPQQVRLHLRVLRVVAPFHPATMRSPQLCESFELQVSLRYGFCWIWIGSCWWFSAATVAWMECGASTGARNTKQFVVVMFTYLWMVGIETVSGLSRLSLTHELYHNRFILVHYWTVWLLIVDHSLKCLINDWIVDWWPVNQTLEWLMVNPIHVCMIDLYHSNIWG